MLTTCAICTKDIDIRPSKIHEEGNYCSRECYGKARTLKHAITRTCDYCGKDVTMPKSKRKADTCYCDKSCAAKAKTGSKSSQWAGGLSSYRTNGLRSHGAVCNRCGYDKYKQVLQVHHKDHDRSNNETDNLEVLCPTCHSVEHQVLHKGTNDKPKQAGTVA